LKAATLLVVANQKEHWEKMSLSIDSKRQCIVLLCDEGYLFPSLVCAKQAREHAPPSAEVVVFLETDRLTPERQSLFEAVSGAAVRLIPTWLTDLLDRSVPKDFFQTHVNRAALFRLFVARLLEDSYERIVYLDGDIQVRRSLDELLTMPLPEGTVGVVPDWVALHSVDGMPHVEANRAYMAGLDLLPEHWSSYFNSGVMMASPGTWNDIGPKALAFLVARPGSCRLHDQSAINHVCRGRTTNLSLRWNFLRHFMALSAYSAIDPAIVHFVGKLKPWDGVFAPWGRAEFEPYVAMASALRGADVTWRRQSPLRRAAYHVKPFVRRDDYADVTYREAIDSSIRKHSGVPKGL
jgi:lipopolysaccharide biosynthesis glycosyltransferase